MRYIHKAGFYLRFRVIRKATGSMRRIWYSLLGMTIGKDTILPKVFCTWPHQVSLGKKCSLEPDIYFKFDGIWRKGPSICIMHNVFLGKGCEFNIRQGIVIGNDSLIASGCKFIDHDHGIATNDLMRLQKGAEQAIHIANNVWLGCNVIVLKGVTIAEGVVVAAGSVVTKSIPANEIWAGIPAKKIGQR